jgi:hypothetical protein
MTLERHYVSDTSYDADCALFCVHLVVGDLLLSSACAKISEMPLKGIVFKVQAGQAGTDVGHGRSTVC